MIISAFVSLCGACEIFSFIFSPITTLLSLPDKTPGIWLASFIGGFPSGAHTISSLYLLNNIDTDDAQRLISCCVCSGPAFLIMAVGKQMLGSLKTGVILFTAQIISIIILTAFFCRTSKRIGKNGSHAEYLTFDSALVSAVSNSTASMLNIFSFVIFFSVTTEILKNTASFSRFIIPFLEVTLGCCHAALLKSNLSIPIIAFLTGFGGLSVCFQILSLAKNSGLTPVMFWRVRLLNGMLCVLITFMLSSLFPDQLSVFSSVYNPSSIIVWSVDRLLGGACLAAMLLLSIQKLDFITKS